MKVGVTIDNYKLAAFERRFTEGGFTWRTTLAPVPHTLVLVVETDRVAELKSACEVALADCQAAALMRMH